MEDREKERQDINLKFPDFYRIGSGLALVIIGALIGGAIFANDPGYKTNLYTEVLSILATVLVLNFFAQRRDEKREEARLKDNLIAQLGSSINEAAIRAGEQLAVNNNLQDGSLRGLNLKGLGLQNANLGYADFTGTRFEFSYFNDAYLVRAIFDNTRMMITHFQGANLVGASFIDTVFNSCNFTSAILINANFRGAKFYDVSFEKADLINAVLVNANLGGAKFLGADLSGSDLQGATLEYEMSMEDVYGKIIKTLKIETDFDTQTTLPNGKLWTLGTDMTQFTNPEHADFWRSPYPYSPAYRGKIDDE